MKTQLRLLSLFCLLASGCASAPPISHPVQSTADGLNKSRVASDGESSAPENRVAEPTQPVTTPDAPKQVAPVGFFAEGASALELNPAQEEPGGQDSARESQAVLEVPPYTIEATPSDDVATGTTGNKSVYTLADIEGLALANNPTLTAAQALVDKSAGLRFQVGRSPNPLVGYFGQQMANRNTDQHGIFIEQEFVRGDKLRLNQEVLGHTQRAQSATTEAQRFRVLTDVRVRFFEAIAAQQRLDAIRNFLTVARKGVQVAEDREEAGEGTTVETLQAKTLLSEIALAEEQAAVALAGAWKDLAAVAGLQSNTPARLQADMGVPPNQPDWDIAYAEIIAISPELAAARSIVCEKSALYRRQQAQPIPNLTAQLGAGQDNGTNHGMINAQLSAPIPAWNKNRGNIRAAYADYVAATREVQRIEQSIRSRLARTSADFESSLRAVRKYEDEIIPQATTSLELSEEAYRAGELNFLQVLILRRSFFESTVRLIDARRSLAQAASKIDGLLLTGGLDAPTDYTDGDGTRGASFGGQ